MKANNRKFKRLWRECGGICWLCDKPMTFEEASRDHLLPQSAGGRHEQSNLKLAHASCNKIRQSVPAEQAREYVQEALRYQAHVEMERAAAT